MASFKLRLRHLCFAVVLSYIAISCCRGQGGGGGAGGAAGGALCFDNRQVMNGCLQAMGINVNGNGNGNSNGNGNGNGNSNSNGSGNGATTSTAAPPALAPAPGPSAAGGGGNNGSTASMCQGPCFGQMMLMMNCVNGILGNIQGYSPGLMQGVQAIFQMSCGNIGNGQGGGGIGGGGAGGGGAGGAGGAGAGGAGGGGSTASSAVATNAAPNGGSHVAVSNVGEPTSSADGPTASLTSGFASMLITWTCIGFYSTSSVLA